MSDNKKLEEEIYRSLKKSIRFGLAEEMGSNPKRFIDLTPQFDAIFRNVAKKIAQQKEEDRE